MKDVVVRFVENDEELRQAHQLMALSCGSGPTNATAWLDSCGAGYPGFRREHTRVALFGSQVVAALRLTTDTIRIGEARLKMGGLGWVATDHAWGRRGIISRVVTDAMRHMQENRYHMSMLFGVSDFYRRWGFAPALGDYSLRIDPDSFESNAASPLVKLRSAKPGDIPAMQRLHAANDTDTACSLIRTQAHLANKWRQWEKVWVLTDARGKLAAYFRGKRCGMDFIVDEAGAADSEACAQLLLAAAALAREDGAGSLCLKAPPGHPVMLLLRRDHPGLASPEAPESAGMLAFVNTGEALESMIPEWESRLAPSPLAHSHAEVTLLAGRAAWRVRAHHGAVDVSPGTGINKVNLSSQEMIQLTAGWRDLDEVLAEKRRIINAEGAALLRAMFPRRQPYVWALDRF